jgi:trk system potassium uptake protein TrkH
MALSPLGTPTARRIRRVSPAQSLLVGFSALVIVGVVPLRLPIASRDGTVQPFVDALFTATSAVTTTGLIVVDTGSYYSPFGQMVILALFQVGGLGYMAFIAFVASVMRRRLSLSAGLTLQESMAGVTASELREFVTSVFAYTLLFEGLGTVALAWSWIGDFPAGRALYLGLFHSVSAFCTAGFSLFPDSFMAYRGDVLINVTVAVVSCGGAVGFFVLRDLARYLPLLWAGKRPRRLTLHTKLALSIWLPLVVAGSAIFLLAEPRSLAGAGLRERLAAATFQAVSACTTTGFNSVDIGKMTATSLFWLVIVMFVGSAPGGTGGGIKSTTLGVVLATVVALLRGRQDTVAFGRRLSEDTVRRALTIGILATVVVIVVTLLLTATERQPFLSILFEVASALGTVGLSAGITPSLSPFGKVVISITMLVGRLGPLAIGFALLARPKAVPFRYAEEKVFLG